MYFYAAMKIAIISDIHEDYPGLKKVAKLIESRGCDEVICLGDVVGFSVPFYTYYESRDASACVEWVKENCRYAVAGNHDLYAVRKLPGSDVRGFSFPENWYQLPFDERQKAGNDKIWLYEDNELSALLNLVSQEYLSQLPEYEIVETDKRRCMLTHFISPDITGSAKEFLLDYYGLMQHLIFMKEHRCSIGFSGHMHANGLVKISGSHLDNVGFGKQVPLLPFDWVGTPSVCESKFSGGFLIWDTATNSVEAISLKRRFNMLKKN